MVDLFACGSMFTEDYCACADNSVADNSAADNSAANNSAANNSAADDSAANNSAADNSAANDSAANDSAANNRTSSADNIVKIGEQWPDLFVNIGKRFYFYAWSIF